MGKNLEKEFEFVNRIIERHRNRAIGLANAEIDRVLAEITVKLGGVL